MLGLCQADNGDRAVSDLGLDGDARTAFAVVQPGQTLRIGNTNSRIRFTAAPDDAFDVSAWMTRWASNGPTHHVALGVGHHRATVQKAAELLELKCVSV